MNPSLTVGLHRYSAGEQNGYGIPAASWEPPLDETGEPLPVYGWAPRGGAEPEGPAPYNILITDLDLLTPADCEIGPDDLVDLPEGQFQVIGHPMDYSNGPFGSQLGMVVKLKRSE